MLLVPASQSGQSSKNCQPSPRTATTDVWSLFSHWGLIVCILGARCQGRTVWPTVILFSVGLLLLTVTDVSTTCAVIFDSEDDYRRGCRNVSHCQQQQSYSGLRSPGRSNSTYFWNDSWVQTFHSFTVQCRSTGRGRGGPGSPPIILTGTFKLVSGHAPHPALRFNVFIEYPACSSSVMYRH